MARHNLEVIVEPEDKARKRPSRTDDEEDEEGSRSRRRRDKDEDDDDDDEDRSSRRYSRSSREEDHDDDDQPRRSRLAPHRAGAILTMGILGLVLTILPVVPLAGLVLAIIAWVMGSSDLTEMRVGRMDREGEGLTSSGRICGMVAVILHIVGVFLVGGFLSIFVFGCCTCCGGLVRGRRRQAADEQSWASYPQSARGGGKARV